MVCRYCRGLVAAMFDPWTATLDEAVRLDEECGDDKALSDPTRPLYQWHAASQVEQRRVLIDKGDGFAVLACIRLCVTHGLVAPKWLAVAFNSRFDPVLDCRVASWDDPKSFGRPYPKGTHLSALRKARQNRHAVWVAVYEEVQRNSDVAIDKELFDRIGKPLGLGATLTEELFREAIALGRPHPKTSRTHPLNSKNFRV